jgi:hypothetical protein
MKSIFLSLKWKVAIIIGLVSASVVGSLLYLHYEQSAFLLKQSFDNQFNNQKSQFVALIEARSQELETLASIFASIDLHDYKNTQTQHSIEDLFRILEINSDINELQILNDFGMPIYTHVSMLDVETANWLYS